MALNKEDNLTNFISSITNLTTEYTKLYPQDKKDIWSILLNYLQNESANGKGDTLNAAIGHDGFRQSDIKNSSVWKIVDSYADLDREQSETLEWFNTLYGETKEAMENYWSSTYYTVYPSDVTRENSLWNDSLEYFLKYFYQYLDPEGVAAYESSGFLVENDDEIINTDYLRASIPVSGGVGMRVTDVKNADAGFYFVKESEIYSSVYIEALETTLKIALRPWVIPWYNVNGHTYSGVRSDDKNIGVLANDEHLQFTRERYGDKYVMRINTSTYTNGHLSDDIVPNTTSKNPYIRLIMPEYKRRVEIEDLDRDFWVIAQVITAISAYLFDDDSPLKNMFKELLNEIMQLWENVLYLWAAVAGLGAEPYYTDVHTEVVYLPNSEEQSYLKYDNFVRGDSSAENYFKSMEDEDVGEESYNKAKTYCKERLRYLIQTYTESNLVIIPVIRVNNYEHNYYKGEYYPFIMVFNRNEKYDGSDWLAREKGVTSDFEFSDYEIIKYPDEEYGFIISINRDVYAIHENEITYDFAFPLSSVDDSSDGIYTESKSRYYGLLRTKCNFAINPSLTSIVNAQENGKWGDPLTILAGDVVKALYNNSLLRYETWYSCNNGVGTLNSITFNQNVSNVDSRENEILRGYYQGELISDFRYTTEIEWSPAFSAITLVPYIEQGINDVTSSTALNSYKADSVVVLEAYVEKYTPNKNEVSLFIGEHMYNCSKDETVDEELYYYLDSFGNLATTQRNCTIRDNINLGAILVIPIFNQQIVYNDFVTYSEYEQYSTANLTDESQGGMAIASYLYLRTVDLYYKTKDKKLKSNNWVFKVTYIYAIGSYAGTDFSEHATYGDYFNTGIDLQSSIYGTTAPVVRVSVHYFTPSALYQKMLLRDSSNSFSSVSNLTVNGGTFDLSGYTAYSLTANGTQRRYGVWGNIAADVTYDFEKYPGNGLTL